MQMVAAINELWLLLAIALVLFMQPGFLMLEAGSVRSKNTINVAQKNIADLIVCGCVFFLIGGQLMLGAGTSGWFGFGGFDLETNPNKLIYLYQFAFCATAATIISGAVAERMAFRGYIFLTCLISAVTYPLFAHLVWGKALLPDNASFLTDIGFLDFAGSTVVHVIGGSAALAAVLIIGPRRDRFDGAGNVVKIRGHSSVLSNFGTLLLVVGWMGFNAGSSTPGTSEFVSIVFNTLIALAFGGAAGFIFGAWKTGWKTHPKASSAGILGGLVSITAGCAYVNFYGAAIIGLIGGFVAVFMAHTLLDKYKIDDPIDAIATHGFAGIVGTLLVALLARPEHITGTRISQFLIQLGGTSMAVVWSFGTTFLFLKLVSKFIAIRVTPEEEEIGLNIAEHDDSFDGGTLDKLIKEKSTKESDLSSIEHSGTDDSIVDPNNQLNTLSRIVDNAKTAQLKVAVVEHERDILASRDPLTGLHNRVSFRRELRSLASLRREEHQGMVIIYADLDGFKAINDSFGHDVGDRVLKVVSERIQSSLTGSSIIARFGGDEFVFQLNVDLRKDGEDWQTICDRLINNISKTIMLDNLELHVGVSLGVSLFPVHGSNLDDLITNSDMALYEAKAKGKGCWVIFEQSMHEKAMRRKRLETDMRRGKDRGEFYFDYQPQVSVKTGQLFGFEALMRWNHPEFGLISPVEFIPIAEETGLIVQLSERLIRDACSTAMEWPLLHGRRCRVSVNISPVQFQRSNVAEMLKTILEETKLPANLLEIEVTEGTLIKNKEETTKVLQKVRDLGIAIAIDDFGTGYSSMSYLQEFPVDRLKVDRSFVMSLESEEADQRIAKTIIDLGRSLGFGVVAEGVEQEGQRKILELLECDEMQGYLCSPPVSRAESLAFIMRASTGASIMGGDDELVEPEVEKISA